MGQIIVNKHYQKIGLIALGGIAVLAVLICYMAGIFSAITLNRLTGGLEHGSTWKTYSVTEHQRTCLSRSPTEIMNFSYISYCDKTTVAYGVINTDIRKQTQKLVDNFFDHGWVLWSSEYYGKSRTEMKQIVNEQLQKTLDPKTTESDKFDFWISKGSVTANFIISPSKDMVSRSTMRQYNFSGSDLPDVSSGEILIVVGLQDEYLRLEFLPFPIFPNELGR